MREHRDIDFESICKKFEVYEDSESHIYLVTFNRRGDIDFVGCNYENKPGLLKTRLYQLCNLALDESFTEDVILPEEKLVWDENEYNLSFDDVDIRYLRYALDIKLSDDLKIDNEGFKNFSIDSFIGQELTYTAYEVGKIAAVYPLEQGLDYYAKSNVIVAKEADIDEFAAKRKIYSREVAQYEIDNANCSLIATDRNNPRLICSGIYMREVIYDITGKAQQYGDIIPAEIIVDASLAKFAEEKYPEKFISILAKYGYYITQPEHINDIINAAGKERISTQSKWTNNQGHELVKISFTEDGQDYGTYWHSTYEQTEYYSPRYLDMLQKQTQVKSKDNR